MKKYLIVFLVAFLVAACTSKENYVCDGNWSVEDVGAVKKQSSFVKLGNKANFDSSVYTLCKTEGNVENYRSDCNKKYEDGVASLNFDVITKTIEYDREKLRVMANLECKKAE